jgi:PAS domain-containing protein
LTDFSPVWLTVAASALVVGFFVVSYRRVARKCRVFEIALNNMSQGPVMFDNAERMVFCNDRYIELYGLSHDVVKPGATLRDVICNHNKIGGFAIDIEKYHAEIIASITSDKTLSRIVETQDGRTISVINRPIAGSHYWVGTSEDIT